MKTKKSKFEPDIIDLQSWLASATEPDLIAIWNAAKYLSSPYEIWLTTWKRHSRPDISELAHA